MLILHIHSEHQNFQKILSGIIHMQRPSGLYLLLAKLMSVFITHSTMVPVFTMHCHPLFIKFFSDISDSELAGRLGPAKLKLLNCTANILK